MSTLPFDVHDHRHQLKQRRDVGEKSLWENKADLPCPVCDEPFAYLLAMDRPTTFASENATQTCIAHQDQGPPVVVFLHA